YERLWDERAARLAERALATTPEYDPDWPVVVVGAEAVGDQAVLANRPSPHAFELAGRLIPVLAEGGRMEEAWRLLDYAVRLEPSEKTAPPVRLALARGALHLAADEAH